MKYVDELLAEALISAPGCPETIVERMLRTSASAFYRETNAWRHTTGVMPLSAGNREVDLDLPEHTVLSRIFWARFGGQDMPAMSLRYLTNDTRKPQAYAYPGGAPVLHLDSIPDRDYIEEGIVVHAAVAPTHSLVELPDEFFEMHRDGILYGAQTRLMAMPNVLWGDHNGALSMASLAEAEKFKARREAESGQTHIPRTVRYGGI